MRRTAATALVFALLVPMPARPADTSPVSVGTFELEVDRAPQIAIARSVRDRAYATSQEAAARRGTRLSAGVTAGRYHELVTDTIVRDYNGLTGEIAARVPLAFSGDDREATLRESETLAARDIDIRVARNDVRRAVRLAYLDIWAAEKKASLTRAYVRNEAEFGSALEIRKNAHLLLESDRLEFASGYALARRNGAQAVRDEAHARGNLGVALGHDVPAFSAVDPSFAGVCPSRAALSAAVEMHSPVLAVLRAQAQSENDIDGIRRVPVDAGVTIAQGVVVQQPGLGPGRQSTIGLDASVPLRAGAIRQATRERLSAERTETQLRIDQALAQAKVDADDIWFGRDQADANVRFAGVRTAASREAVREALLRYGRLPGDTLEKVGQSRYAYYQAAVDEIDARRAMYASQADMLYVAGEGCTPSAQPAAVVALASGTEPRYGTYAWESREVFALWTSGSLWQMLADQRIAQLALSLDGKQISDAATPAGRDRLGRFLADAHAHSVTVDLLLGDPHWILPGERNELTTILGRLHSIPFDGVQLDLEPASLVDEGETRATAYGEVAHTLAAARSASAWPVSVTVNDRDLEQNGVGDLTPLGLRDVAVMIYSSNPERTVQRMIAVLARYPKISFTLVQSVESTISADESYARRGRAAFGIAMGQIDGALRKYPNYRGISLQSLHELGMMAR
jgi:outer membrane protein TolC